MLSPKVFAILAVYFGLTTAGPLALRQEECGGDWECAPIVDTIPTCARPCIADGAAQVGCDADDFVCRCQNRNAISDLVTGCVLSSCEISDAIKTIEGTESLCSCVGDNGGPQPACPPASSSVEVPPASSAAPPSSTAAPPISSKATLASSVVPPVSSAPTPPASSTNEPPSYPTGPVPSESAPLSSAPSAAPVPSCSAVPAPAPAGPWGCQSLADAVHDCAVPCIAEGAVSIGCDSSDYTCRCENAEAISSAATACVIGACGIPTALEVRQQTADLCTCVASNPPPSGDDEETPAPAPVEGCPPPTSTPAPEEPGYPTEPPKDGDDDQNDEEPVKPEPNASATYPATPEPSTPVEEEPPVVTAGAAKILGSGAAALVALVVAL